MSELPTLARLLPPDAARALQRAAQTQNTPADRLARAKAIDQATYAARLKYPSFFQKLPTQE